MPKIGWHSDLHGKMNLNVCTLLISYITGDTIMFITLHCNNYTSNSVIPQKISNLFYWFSHKTMTSTFTPRALYESASQDWRCTCVSPCCLESSLVTGQQWVSSPDNGDSNRPPNSSSTNEGADFLNVTGSASSVSKILQDGCKYFTLNICCFVVNKF